MTTDTSRERKIAAFLKAVPLLVLVGGQIVKILIEVKIKMWSSRKHFKRGLMEAGLDEKETEMLTKRCYNGGD